MGRFSVRLSRVGAAFLLLTSCQSTKMKPMDDVLVMAYFTDETAGLQLAYSYDSKSWKRISRKASFYKPEQGLYRDPFIQRSPDGDFIALWTTGWHGSEIGFSRSKDLLHWESMQLLPLMKNIPDTANCWAPEWIYLQDQKKYLIFWSSTVTKIKKWNHRIYYSLTTDFKNFSPAQILFDPGFMVIDATMAKEKDKYYLFFKDERGGNEGINSKGGMKAIHWVSSPNPTGPWSIPSDAIEGEIVSGYENAAEGPELISFAGKWNLFFDYYRKGKFGHMQADKIEGPWEKLKWSHRMNYPASHGSFLKIKFAELEKLLND